MTPDDTLREQVTEAVGNAVWVIDPVLALFAEHERLLRERVEALPRFNVRSEVDPEQVQRALIALDDVLAVFDDAR